MAVALSASVTAKPAASCRSSMLARGIPVRRHDRGGAGTPGVLPVGRAGPGPVLGQSGFCTWSTASGLSLGRIQAMSPGAMRPGGPICRHCVLPVLGGPGGSLAERVRLDFGRFATPDCSGLFDLLHGPEGDDPSVRPNRIFAVSLPHCPLDPQVQAAVVPSARSSRPPRPPALRGLESGLVGSRRSTPWGKIAPLARRPARQSSNQDPKHRPG
jgi:hypothetical protein